MTAALTHQDTLDGCTTIRAFLPGPAEHIEFVGITAFATGNRVEISRPAAQGGAHVFQPGSKHQPYGPVQGFDFFFR